MPPAIVTRMVAMREAKDCAIAAISMYTGRTYEDVLREVVIVDPKHRGRTGLHDPQIRKVMKALGVPVRYRARVDYDDDYGLLRLHDHMALLRNGLIAENDTLWDVDDWRQQRGYRDDCAVMGIFVAVDA
jgi:hypothetical protein